MQVTDADMHHLTRRGVEMLPSSVKAPSPPDFDIEEREDFGAKGANGQ